MKLAPVLQPQLCAVLTSEGEGFAIDIRQVYLHPGIMVSHCQADATSPTA